MSRHVAAVQNQPSSAQLPCMATPSSAKTTSSEATRRVRECKARLFQTLQRRHRDAWRTYWTAFQQYLMAKQSIQQFQATAERLLGAENITLHNAFMVALLQDCSEKEDDATDYHGDSGASTGDSEASVGENGVKSEDVEPDEQRDVHDTESAELLMGLGRFVGH